jgi:two-component system sensor histidine kinase VicK
VLLRQLERQIEISQSRLREMQQYARDSSCEPKDLIENAISELAVAIEELHVTAETLNQQNQELLETRAALEIERTRYQQLFTLAPDGYLVTDVRGIIKEANLNAEYLFNRDRKYLVGKPLVLSILQSERQAFYTQLEKLSKPPKDCSIHEWEITLHPRDRTPFPVAIVTSCSPDLDGNIISLHWSIRDISERKAVEAARNALQNEQEISKQKSRLMRTLSHELRSPLHVINMAAQLLETRYSTGTESPSPAPLFQKIYKAREDIIHLLDNILAIGKSELGKLEFKPQSLYLPSFCAELVERYKLQADRGKTIRLEVQGKLPPAQLDANLLLQIFGNLLTNALKYSPENSEVVFSLEATRDRIICRIQDWGIGIPLDDQKHLFEPFHRASNTSNRPGNGLGLSIVKKAVELHCGKIDCSSTEGVGTTFTIELPLYPTHS